MIDTSGLQLVGDGVIEQTVAKAGDLFVFRADDIHRERGGVHARVSIMLRDKTVAYDTFNLARNEERNRLSKAVFSQFSDGLKEDYPQNILKYDLDNFCHDLPEYWEETRLQEDCWDIDIEVPPLEYYLWPYGIKGAGTIIFAPPASGKSWLLMTMALCIGTGRLDFWRIRPAPVYFINLERSADSVRRRLIMLCRAMTIRTKDYGITFLNAKGMGLTAVARRAKRFVQEHPNCVIMLDSISRAGQGDLNENDTGNKVVDMLNSIGPTWIAIGHTPRNDSDHLFGSQMFDAGADVLVKVASEIRGNTLGLSLDVKKGTELARQGTTFMAYEFTGGDSSELCIVRDANRNEFPKLLIGESKSDEQRIIEYVMEMGRATAGDITTALGIKRSDAATILASSDEFTVIEKTAKGTFYGLRSYR